MKLPRLAVLGNQDHVPAVWNPSVQAKPFSQQAPDPISNDRPERLADRGAQEPTATDGLRIRRTPDATRRDNVLGGLAPHAEIEAQAAEGDWLRAIYGGVPAYIHGGFVELAPTHNETSPGERSPFVLEDGILVRRSPPRPESQPLKGRATSAAGGEEAATRAPPSRELP